MGEELDPSLEPVLAKAFVKRGNAVLIKLGDKEIDFNPDFRLYITTKLGALPVQHLIQTHAEPHRHRQLQDFPLSSIIKQSPCVHCLHTLHW